MTANSLKYIIYSQKNNCSLQNQEAKRSSEGQSQYNKSKQNWSKASGETDAFSPYQ